MIIEENTNILNKTPKVFKKRERPVSQKYTGLKKNWRLIQLMTVLEDYQGSSLTYKKDQSNYKNEVTYKNTYITNPLVPCTTISPLSASLTESKTLSRNLPIESIERFPISANFVAQWLSENIVSSKNYKLTILCDRVIKAANLNEHATKKPSAVGGLTNSKQLVGVKIIISGRILGAEIATSKTFKAGQIPSNTINILKDAGFALAKTRSGTIGIKVIYFWKS